MAVCKVGILGCGNISSTYVADIQRFYKDLQIVACANRSPEKAQALAEQFGIPKACTPEELLQDPEVELVINLTPPQSHVELNKQILAAGKHLFSEKPFAPTLDRQRKWQPWQRKRAFWRPAPRIPSCPRACRACAFTWMQGSSASPSSSPQT